MRDNESLLTYFTNKLINLVVKYTKALRLSNKKQRRPARGAFAVLRQGLLGLLLLGGFGRRLGGFGFRQRLELAQALLEVRADHLVHVEEEAHDL